MKTYTKEQLVEEISRRRPWYQSIDFAQYGISTTDDPANAFNDQAWDNKIDAISIADATRLRPKPKWEQIKTVLPDVAGLEVLEIGSNCGFFSFAFAAHGAKSVVGLDVAPKWLSNAEWCRNVLGYENVSFLNCDFMVFDGAPASCTGGLLSNENASVPLPNNRFDLIFTSTVLDHLFFPLFAIYKMIRMARQWVVIDIPRIDPRFKDESLLKLSYPDDLSHHGFNGSKTFFTGYIQRLGISSTDVYCHEYNDGFNLTYIIDTRNAAPGLYGA